MKETTLVAHLPGVGAREKNTMVALFCTGGINFPRNQPPRRYFPPS